MKLLTLDEIRKSQLESLNIFREFCEKNNLKYYIAFGTLLGAVRHKGYIPWDDDMDIFMPRDSYNYFIKNFNKVKINKREVISREINSKFYLEFAKIIDCNTILVEQDQKIKIGVWIDVFPLEYMVDNKIKLFFTNLKIRIYGAFIPYVSLVPLKRRKFYKNIIIRIIKFILPSKDYLKGRVKKEINKIKSSGKSNTYGIAYRSFGIYGVPLFSVSKFEPSIKLEFEGELYNAPRDYKSILIYMYGITYMKLPPKRKQKNTHTYTCYWRDKK